MKSASGMIVDHKKVLNQLAELIQKEEGCVVRIYADSARVDAQKEILEIARSKIGEKFVVLVIGAFSSGKSSMINAMIGEELLPTGFLPETAFSAFKIASSRLSANSIFSSVYSFCTNTFCPFKISNNSSKDVLFINISLSLNAFP